MRPISNAAEHGAGQRADAAQHGRGEGFDADQKADVEVDNAVTQQEQQAGDGGERRAHHEGQRDRAVDIDADQPRHHPILFAGPLRAAQRGARDQQRKGDHQEQGQQNDDDLHIAERHRIAAVPHHGDAALDHRRQGLDARALDQLDVVLQKDRHADGRDQRRQPERAAQRPVGQSFHGPAVDRCQQHGDDQDQQQREWHPGDADHAHDQEGDQRREGADHEDIAMGEIDHADDAIDHGVADGDQTVDRTQCQTVDELLREDSYIEIFHENPCPPNAVTAPFDACPDHCGGPCGPPCRVAALCKTDGRAPGRARQFTHPSPVAGAGKACRLPSSKLASRPTVW